jgi:hypothetical protein
MNRDRGWRRQQRERILNNRGRDAKTFNVTPKDGQIGRFADRHPLDCGNPGCLVCHASKVLDLKTLQQLKDKSVIRDSTEELLHEEGIDQEDTDAQGV